MLPVRYTSRKLCRNKEKKRKRKLHFNMPAMQLRELKGEGYPMVLIINSLQATRTSNTSSVFKQLESSDCRTRIYKPQGLRGKNNKKNRKENSATTSQTYVSSFKLLEVTFEISKSTKTTFRERLGRRGKYNCLFHITLLEHRESGSTFNIVLVVS